jgi:hypothetical protein
MAVIFSPTIANSDGLSQPPFNIYRLIFATFMAKRWVPLQLIRTGSSIRIRLALCGAMSSCWCGRFLS